MSYVVYNVQSTRIVGSRNTLYFKSHGAARAQLTRMGKQGLDITEYGIAEINYYYQNIEKKVTRVNLMTGAEFYESVNTPSYCSPASESYWSM
jgi:hypothetical protein